MINNLTLMFFCLFIGFLLIFGAFIDHHYAKEDARHAQKPVAKHIKTSGEMTADEAIIYLYAKE